jgi:hypothetical protein
MSIVGSAARTCGAYATRFLITRFGTPLVLVGTLAFAGGAAVYMQRASDTTVEPASAILMTPIVPSTSACRTNTYYSATVAHAAYLYSCYSAVITIRYTSMASAMIGAPSR